MNFGNEIWYKVPILRYDEHDDDHITLAELALEAEGIAQHVQNRTNKSVYDALWKVGITSKIDRIAGRIVRD